MSDLDVGGVVVALAVISLLFVVPGAVLLHDMLRDHRAEQEPPADGG